MRQRNTTPEATLPQSQQELRARCVHPRGNFVPFRREEIEQALFVRFEQQVADRPQHIALQTLTEAYTYAELNGQANRLAHCLLAQYGPEAAPVALLCSHEALAIAAMLGVLKAGKFYVPLDPAHPPARLALLLADAAATVLVTDAQNVALARALAQDTKRVIVMEQLDPGLPTDNPGHVVAPHALAYILYTSGSTGQPKGVVDCHRNVLHHMMRMTNEVHICTADRQTLLRSYSFNGAVRDIFATLLNGATLCAFPVAQLGVAPLADWLAAAEITLYRSVMSVFRQLLSTLTGTEAFPKLRVIHIGGEPIHRQDIALYQRYFSAACILLHGLGITEVGTTRHYYLSTQTPIPASPVPVGYRVEDMEVLLLDDDGAVVGVETEGEIAVRSPYLARGYWQQEALTRAKFLPDPAGTEARLYLTGDLGRMAADGCLLHLGRKDQQVKVQGQRVDTTEVEAALLDLGTLRQAFVTQRLEDPHDTRLVAYVVPHTPPGPTVSALRQALAALLPAPMIPATFVFLEALPLFPHGKVERRALPAPDQSRPALDIPYQPPQTPIEKALAQLWATVLQRHPIGLDDAFLDLGGQSLLATQIAARVRDTWQVDIPMGAFFEAATVRQMASLIVQHLLIRTAPDELERLRAEVDHLSA